MGAGRRVFTKKVSHNGKYLARPFFPHFEDAPIRAPVQPAPRWPLQEFGREGIDRLLQSKCVFSFLRGSMVEKLYGRINPDKPG